MARDVRRLAAAIGAVGLTGFLVASGPVSAQGRSKAPGGTTFRIGLSGANEVPAVTHAAHTGSVVLRLNQGRGTICYRFGAMTLPAGEPLPVSGHIHRGRAGEAPPANIVVTLFGNPPNATGTTPTAPAAYPSQARCVRASKALIKEIRQNAEGFYVNVHNPPHPAGVMRGQLA